MDEVSKLIQEVEVPMVGICFGHQIIAASLGGKVVRAKKQSQLVTTVEYNNGSKVNALFTHQDHVIHSGEMEVIASAEHCGIVACKHPTRNIRTVQYHPEATAEVILKAMEYGEMSEEESNEFDLSKSMISLKQSLL